MTRPQLRVVDTEQTHPRDLARQAVAEFKLDRERGEKPLPVATDHDIHGAPLLDRDAVVRASYPNYVQESQRRRGLLRRLLRWR